MLAIIKLIKIKTKAENDIEKIGVQAILLVEDSIRYYSSYLPTIYKVIFGQQNELMTEGLNENQKTMAKRARPKILLAKTYEEALLLYNKYKNNLLGVISDISFPKNGIIDSQAGLKLGSLIRNEIQQMPILLQSSDEKNKSLSTILQASFIHKYSKTLLADLKNYIKYNYGFGDFIFKDPVTNNELDRANNLNALQVKLASIPGVFRISCKAQPFFKMAYSKSSFSLADLFKQKSREDFNHIEEVRNYLIDTIENFRKSKAHGVIACYNDEYAVFSRIEMVCLAEKLVDWLLLISF